MSYTLQFLELLSLRGLTASGDVIQDSSRSSLDICRKQCLSLMRSGGAKAWCIQLADFLCVDAWLLAAGQQTAQFSSTWCPVTNLSGWVACKSLCCYPYKHRCRSESGLMPTFPEASDHLWDNCAKESQSKLIDLWVAVWLYWQSNMLTFSCFLRILCPVTLQCAMPHSCIRLKSTWIVSRWHSHCIGCSSVVGSPQSSIARLKQVYLPKPCQLALEYTFCRVNSPT